MSNRHLSRTIALQTLFEWDFYHRSKKLFDILERNLQDFASDFDDNGFTQALIKGVTRNLSEIDRTIQKFAPDWPIDQITLIDRNVIRLGAYELEHEREIPPKVTINESIELAKTFGGPASHRFVNGVLGAIYKDLEKRGICIDPSLSQQTGEELSPETASPAQEISAGGLVFRRDSSNKLHFALILDAINKWTFPKGKVGDHIEGEGLQEAATREVKEELGIANITLLHEIGSISVTVNPPSRPSFPKIIHYYLFETRDETLHPEKQVTCQDAQWFTEIQAMTNLGYANTKELFQKALNMIKNRESN